MKILTVLRSGGEYRQEHVERLRAQCVKWAPDVPFECLSDMDGTLRHNWPGWWCKMAMFEDVREPFLYMDLDSAVVGDIAPLLARDELTVLSDFYRLRQINSGLMLVTPEAAQAAWAEFTADPERHMRECVTRERWGDQGFLEGVWGRDVARWQDTVDGIVSWKVHCRRRVPSDARVICWHGRPRPWEVGW